MDAAAIEIHVPMPQITSEVLTGLITLALTVVGIYGKKELDKRRFSNGKDRRKIKFECPMVSNNSVEILSSIADRLTDVGNTLKESRISDAEHRREEVQALRGIFKVQMAIARREGIEGLDFIDEPGRQI